MSDILETIAEHTRIRVAKAKEAVAEEVMRDRAYEKLVSENGTVPSFTQALAKPGMSFICECKKASPSKGIIAEDFPYLEIAKEYEEAGASAISVLSEPEWFKGSLNYVEEIAAAVSVPVLRKDFTVSPYMIYEAYLAGASAVLLICSILDDNSLSKYRMLAEDLGMAALVEAHDEDEVKMAIDCGASIIGVNNRDLRTFEVNAANCLRLRDKIPDGILFVAESGINSAEDIRVLTENKVDAVLIGEAMMRSADKKAFLDNLRSGA